MPEPWPTRSCRWPASREQRTRRSFIPLLGASANAGTINGTTTFTSFQNLVGGTKNDTFSLGNGASVSGTINGAGGSDTLNYSAYATPVSVNLNEQNDVQTVTINAASGTWNLLFTTINGLPYGASNLPYNISLSALQADLPGLLGNMTVTGTPGSSYVLTFTGTLANTFVPLGAVSGTAAPSIVHTTVGAGPGAGLASAVGGGFTNIESFVGGSSGSDTLTGPNAPSTWHITGANAGLVNGIAFASFENLAGGTSSDAFDFSNGASVSGSVNGGGGSDTLNYSAWTVGPVQTVRTSL